MYTKIAMAAALVCAPCFAWAQNGLDLIVPAEGTQVLEKGLYEYRSVQIGVRGRLVVKGGVTIAAEKFSAADGATLEYKSDSMTQENISISTFDASGLTFLYIDASGRDGANQTGAAAGGPPGRNAHKTGYSISELNGRSANRGGPGATGARGGIGQPAANVSLHLPNLRVGSLLRIHATGGSGGKGQQGGQGGKGGEGAFGHPAADGGPGGAGGEGGAAGDAGKISVYLVVADDATDADKDSTLKTLRLEYANAAGTPGEAGPGGPGGGGGSGAVGGGSGTGGSRGSLGSGGGQGAVGIGPASKPNERWIVTSILTQSQYAKQYAETLQKIREAMSVK